MELAGKYRGFNTPNGLKAWSETPEATGGQYPTLHQELNRQLNILKTAQPGSQEAIQAMIAVSELQNVIKSIPR